MNTPTPNDKQHKNPTAWEAATAIGDAGVQRARRAIHRHFADVAGVALLGTDPESQARGDLVVTQRDGRRWCCEVKTDDKANATGNLAIEQSRRMSVGAIGTGISTSQADVWAFVLDDRILFADPNEIRAIIGKRRAAGTLQERWCGDKGRTCVALVRVSEVEALQGTFVVLEGGTR